MSFRSKLTYIMLPVIFLVGCKDKDEPEMEMYAFHGEHGMICTFKDVPKHYAREFEYLDDRVSTLEKKIKLLQRQVVCEHTFRFDRACNEITTELQTLKFYFNCLRCGLTRRKDWHELTESQRNCHTGLAEIYIFGFDPNGVKE